MCNKNINLKEKIKEIDNEIYKLESLKEKYNNDYIEELYNKCQNYVGKCYKDQNDNYYKIVSTKNIDIFVYKYRFDEYRYDCLSFKYPYDLSSIPFKNEEIHKSSIIKENYDEKLINNLSKTFKKTLIEIEPNEFIEKFNEVNKSWVNNINKRGDGTNEK